MGAVDTTYTFTATDTITSTKMNNIIDQTTMTDDSIWLNDGLEVASGKIRITGGGITSSKLAPNSVATNAITDLNVTTGKIANDAITTGKLANNSVTNDKIRDSAGLSVIGNPTNSTSGPVDIVAGSDNQIFMRSGGALVFQSTIPSTSIPNSSITPAKLNGGQSGSAPIFGVRAWAAFNGGSSSPSLSASGNMSSVAYGAVGRYTLTFQTSMADANYAVVATSGIETPSGSNETIVSIVSKSASSFTIQIKDLNNTDRGSSIVSVMVIR